MKAMSKVARRHRNVKKIVQIDHVAFIVLVVVVVAVVVVAVIVLVFVDVIVVHCQRCD